MKWTSLAIILLLGSDSSIPAVAADTARITGTVGYPSDYIPEDLQVCAENTVSGEAVCTDDRMADANGSAVLYEIEVPPGQYAVYAQLTDPASFSDAYGKDYRAYYSEFVTCGLLATCTSHAPIAVTVRAGETATGIDPNDWYNFP